MKASGEPGQRGYRQEAQGTGEGEMGGPSSKEIKKAPKSLLTSHRGLTFGTLWEAGEGGLWGGCQSEELPQNSVPTPTPPPLLRAVLSVCSMAVF